MAALKVYQQGHGHKGGLTWTPVPRVVDAFHLAFESVKPTGKNYLLALDVSGSMGCLVGGLPGVTARAASAAMAMLTARTERRCHLVGFSRQLVPLDVSPRQRLDDVIRVIERVPTGSTDCAQPMLYDLRLAPTRRRPPCAHEPRRRVARCAAVPPPRRHTVRYVGVLASASKLRSRIVPPATSAAAAACEPGVDDVAPSRVGGRYRPWAELLKRTFALDVLACAGCGGRLRRVAMVTEVASIARYLRAVGEPVEPPSRSPARGPPYWASRALRRRAGDVDAA